METSPGGPPPGMENGRTYAEKTSMNPGSTLNKVKLNILDVILERRDPSISFNLSKDELSKLLFQRMKLPPNQIVKIDTSAFGKIHLELSPLLLPEQFMNLPAFDIRNGLRTKFYKPHHKKEVLITISWLDLETPNDFLCHILSFFGKIKSGIQYSKFKEEPGESREAKLLNNILSGERKVWMDVEKDIPSYGVINGRRVKIYYNGQKRTCARCCKSRDHCPGESNAKICEENGGEKVKTEKMWKETLEAINYTPWMVEEAEIVEVDTNEEAVENEEIDASKFDGITLDNLKENSSDLEIMELLEKVCTNEELKDIKIHPTGSTKSKLLTFSDIKPIPAIWKKIDQKIFDGRMIHSRPHVPLTPPKTANKDQNPGPNPEVSVTPNKQQTPPAKSTPKIPGLPEQETSKVAKKVRNKKKKQEKVNQPKAKPNEKKDDKKTNDMVKEDFMYGSDDSVIEKPIEVKDYAFSEYETDSEPDVFEDSKEEPEAEKIEQDNLFTPLKWKSKSAANIALAVAKESPHPRANSLSQAKKRSAPSPKERENKKTKSLLPVKSSFQPSDSQ